MQYSLTVIQKMLRLLSQMILYRVWIASNTFVNCIKFIHLVFLGEKNTIIRTNSFIKYGCCSSINMGSYTYSLISGKEYCKAVDQSLFSQNYIPNFEQKIAIYGPESFKNVKIHKCKIFKNVKQKAHQKMRNY